MQPRKFPINNTALILVPQQQIVPFKLFNCNFAHPFLNRHRLIIVFNNFLANNVRSRVDNFEQIVNKFVLRLYFPNRISVSSLTTPFDISLNQPVQLNSLLFFHNRFGTILLLNPFDFAKIVLTTRQIILLQIGPLHLRIPTFPQIYHMVFDLLHQRSHLQHLSIDLFAMSAAIEDLLWCQLPVNQLETGL